MAVSIFIGLFQVWVKPATIVKLLGKGSGYKGVALVCVFPILMGGSLFTIFPLLKTLRDKGARMGAIASFITAWGGKRLCSRWKSPFLGWRFALLRLSFVVVFAFVDGYLGGQGL
ncbi:MAG: permease [Desulfobacterales bacterium]|nr:permease [Desulfobacterales bacterium]